MVFGTPWWIVNEHTVKAEIWQTYVMIAICILSAQKLCSELDMQCKKYISHMCICNKLTLHFFLKLKTLISRDDMDIQLVSYPNQFSTYL